MKAHIAEMKDDITKELKPLVKGTFKFEEDKELIIIVTDSDDDAKEATSYLNDMSNKPVKYFKKKFGRHIYKIYQDGKNVNIKWTKWD
jgi:hypothetical protein